MAPKKKPQLIQVGEHLVSLEDVAAIKSCKKGKLYIVVLRSQPNPEFPMWVREHELTNLLSHFEIISSDDVRD